MDRIRPGKAPGRPAYTPWAGRPTPLGPAGLGPSGLGSGSKNSGSNFGDLPIYVLQKVSYEKVRKREGKFGRNKEKKKNNNKKRRK